MLKQQSAKALNTVKKNWHRLSNEKKELFVLSLWNGILPTELPLHLKIFEKQLKEIMANGTEGQAWDLIIKETKELIKQKEFKYEDHKYYFKKLLTNFYVNFVTQEEKELNEKLRPQIQENVEALKQGKQFDKKLLKIILKDLEKSRLINFDRHCEKWGTKELKLSTGIVL
jgi:hypothetical protein